MVIRTEDEIFLQLPGQPPTDMLSGITSEKEYATCVGCSAEHLVRNLLDDHFETEIGVCNHCGSSEFLTLLKDSSGDREIRVVFNPRTGSFHHTYLTSLESLDLDEVWQRYNETGEIDFSSFLSEEVTGIPEELNDLLRLELMLHRSAAELYAKLRSIPLASVDAKGRRERALLKLKMLRRELIEISEQL
jgi:hypothetical protein